MPSRPRRRAVGPPGAAPTDAGVGPLPAEPRERDRAEERTDDERLRADRPPHHDQGV